MPRISVVLPIFNSERYLSEAVDSILAQTFEDFELLLFDDGSTDGSSKIAQEAAARDTRVILVRGDHRGYVSWLNTGVEMAKAEFIARMDADDIASHDRFERQVEFLEKHPECCVVGTRAIRIDPDGSPISPWRVPEDHVEIDGRHIQGRPGAIIHPSVMMRKRALSGVGGYRAQYEPAEDYDLFLRLAEVGRVANLGEPLLRYRIHEKCVTFARAEAQSRWTRQALADAWVRRGKTGSPPAPLNDHKTPSTEELMWSWALTAFSERNFLTARKQAFRLLQRRPSELRRWVLFAAACLGPLAFRLRRFCSYRVGPYRPQAEEI
jgi:glycosyltransferase involved in cell wall biosynthesis